MVDDSDKPIKYPCYFLYGAEGGLITNFVDGRRCLCLFTSTEAVRRFTVAAHDLHKNKRGYRKAESDEVENKSGLVGRLTAAVDRLEVDGIRYISIDPVPGQPTVHVAIRDYIAGLQTPISE